MVTPTILILSVFSTLQLYKNTLNQKENGIFLSIYLSLYHTYTYILTCYMHADTHYPDQGNCKLNQGEKNIFCFMGNLSQ